ncbi:CE1759 family FMN reductase [Arthrobacter rhizosphaerae]|uniref:CE1759 family FMN reductase n=1 Tax=Arthrobacter rhizosphaerae TaxID=2855490 RepID=UPI001FF3124E|nr:CE1759 family FMN reductase [Arthrobacter rhizosphaerae]
MSADSSPTAAAVSLVVVTAGVSEPSSTRMLADRLAGKTTALLAEQGRSAQVRVIELAPLALDIARATTAGFPGSTIEEAMKSLSEADALIVSTPVYKAGISGLLKSFVDLIDSDLLIGKPVMIAATAGTARHALVVDDHLRSLFAYFRALTLPTSVFAAPEDWGSPAFGDRIERAAQELAQVIRTGVGRAISDAAWSGYQHEFAGRATRAAQTTQDLDFDSTLMQLAAGGAGRNSSSTRLGPDAGS